MIETDADAGAGPQCIVVTPTRFDFLQCFIKFIKLHFTLNLIFTLYTQVERQGTDGAEVTKALVLDQINPPFTCSPPPLDVFLTNVVAIPNYEK